MATRTDFHYSPTGTGVISGAEVLIQTEDAINDLGEEVNNYVDSIETALNNASEAASTAETALNNANTALALAQTNASDIDTLELAVEAAQSSADAAQTAADAAQTTADEALALATTTSESAAPIYHASSADTYGLGSGSLYGHVQLSDSTDSDSGEDGGVAATPAAVAAVLAVADAAQSAAEAAQTAAEAAQDTADTATTAATTAQEGVDANASDIDALEAAMASVQAQLSTDEATISDNATAIASALTYADRGAAIDADEQTETGRIYVDSQYENTNFPTENSGYLLVEDDDAGAASADDEDEDEDSDTDDDDDATTTSGAWLKQTFTDLTTGSVYVRIATITYETTTTENDDGEEETTTTTSYTWGDWASSGGDYLPLSGGTLTGGVFGASVTATADIDVSTGSVFSITIEEDTTITISGTPESTAACFSLILTNGGDCTVTWPDTVKWADGSAPDLTSGGVDVLTFLTADGGETWYGCVSITGAA